ncbi:S41 family peptidase [candidate division KSB1 bacterium]|nr:S41 family peptidase [candidate division KSB1 bacterium]
MKKIRSYKIKLFIVFIIVSIIIGLKIPQHIVYGAQKVYNKWMILTMILDKIERHYIDDTNSDELLINAINGMLSGLDPYSVYLTPEEYKNRESKYLGFIGLGLKVKYLNDNYVIVSVIDKSPAFIAGLYVSDIILEIDGKKIKNLKIDQVEALLQGPENTKVNILVSRAGQPNPQSFTVNRRYINIKSIPCAFMIDNTTGYIKITHFVESTPHELDEAFKLLQTKGMNKLLLDLRENSGGAFKSGVDVADRFISGGKLIVFTRGKNSQAAVKYVATSGFTLPEMPLIILVNGGTASVAEIVAAAIQDWDRGLLLGSTTYGKALVQTEFPFQDGSALLLTTAIYYTPLGRMIQRDLDTVVDKPGKETTKALSKTGKWTEFKTPGGRIVYEGNGLRPDFFLTENKNIISQFVYKLYARNLFFSFAEKYIKEHPDVEAAEDYFSDFFITDAILNEFLAFVKKSGFGFSEGDVNKNKLSLKRALKQEIAFILWGIDGAIHVAAQEDPQIKECIVYFDKAKSLL